MKPSEARCVKTVPRFRSKGLIGSKVSFIRSYSFQGPVRTVQQYDDLELAGNFDLILV